MLIRSSTETSWFMIFLLITCLCGEQMSPFPLRLCSVSQPHLAAHHAKGGVQDHSKSQEPHTPWYQLAVQGSAHLNSLSTKL